MNFEVTKYQPVEIPIPSGFTGTEITFPNQPSLYNKKIKAIEVYSEVSMPKSPLTFTDTLPYSDGVNSFLEFFDGNNQKVNRVPYAVLNRVNDQTNGFVFEVYKCNDWLISWDKCKLIFSTPPATTPAVLTVGVYYEDLEFTRPLR